MTRRNRRHRQNRHKISNNPIMRHKTPQRQHDHSCYPSESKHHAPLEAAQDPWDLDEEVGQLGFLGGRAPGHVYFEHVGEERGGDVQGEAAEEDSEEEDPFGVFEDCGMVR